MKTLRMKNPINCLRPIAIVMALAGFWISLTGAEAFGQTGWAVGATGDKLDKGMILYSADASKKGNKAWEPQAESLTLPGLNSIFVLGTNKKPGPGYAVGNAPGKEKPGTILFWDGKDLVKQSWTPQGVKGKHVNGANLYGVFFLEEKAKNKNVNRGWAVGFNGLVLLLNGKTWEEQPTDTTSDLYGVFFQDARNGVAVGQNGTILYTTTGGTSWKEAAFEKKPTKTFRSVTGLSNKVRYLAVGDDGVYSLDDKIDGKWKKLGDKNQPDPQDKLTIIRWNGNTSQWIGRADAPDVFNCYDNKCDPLDFKNFGAVYGLSIIDLNKIWIAGQAGKIAVWDGKWDMRRQPKDENQKLNGIWMFSATKSPVKLDSSVSPDTGIPGVNSVTTTAYDVPAGDINPQHVIIEFAADCQINAVAMTYATSVVSGDGNSKLISFLLPGSLDPGQYFIRISDPEEGDATFESSNCSAVNIAQ